MVKLAVAIHHRTVSASPGFDSRPMHFAVASACNINVASIFALMEQWVEMSNFNTELSFFAKQHHSWMARCNTHSVQSYLGKPACFLGDRKLTPPFW